MKLYMQVATSTLAAGLSLLIAGSTVVPPPAAALTVEQQLFLEVGACMHACMSWPDLYQHFSMCVGSWLILC